VLQIEQFTNAKVDVEIHVERKKFEDLNEDLFKRALIPVEECLKEANLSAEEIDEVVMVGGSSRMPKIRQILSQFFNGKHMRMRINPDEAIAYGAAIQAAICTEEYSGNIHISEITPISLGVDVRLVEMDIIIPKNTKIPCSMSKRYVTMYDNQDGMDVKVYQGECESDKHKNTLLGKFTLDGITLAPAGKTAAIITLTLDEDGILHVKAVEEGKGNNQMSLTITKNVM
jgi:molecular chaperone DnaK (HSP70)